MILQKCNSWAAFPSGSVVRIPLPMQEMLVWFLGQENPLEEEGASHSSPLAWKIPGIEEPAFMTTVHGVAKSQTLLSDWACTIWTWKQKSTRLGKLMRHHRLTDCPSNQSLGLVIWDRPVHLAIAPPWLAFSTHPDSDPLPWTQISGFYPNH